MVISLELTSLRYHKSKMCDNFKPQAWRKKVCQNCFHPKDEHTIVEESSQKDNDGKFAPPPRTFSFKNLHARDQGESCKYRVSNILRHPK